MSPRSALTSQNFVSSCAMYVFDGSKKKRFSFYAIFKRLILAETVNFWDSLGQLSNLLLVKATKEGARSVVSLRMMN